MRFIEIPIIDKEGNETILPINPDNIMWLEKTGIPSNLAGAPDSPGTMIVFIGGIGQRTKMTREELEDLLSDSVAKVIEDD